MKEWSRAAGQALLLTLPLLVWGQGALAGSSTLPLLMSASNASQQGFVRIVNRSGSAGTVRIDAIDDAGARAGPIFLSLDPWQTAHFNSQDLERGNAGKGLIGSIGDGHGNWRLEIEAELDIESLAYVRTTDGFLTSMHERAAETAESGSARQYWVPTFNPASNRNQRSRLRLVNLGDEFAEITITGRDDDGSPVDGEVRLTLAPGVARMLTSQDLEGGARGLVGKLGDGKGKWQLFVSTPTPLDVMSLLQSPTGNLTNLSRGVPAGTTDIPLFISGSNPTQQGFVRLVNRTDSAGTVRIHAIDDAGRRFGPVSLSLGPRRTVHFNSQDLERGNAAKGLFGGVGHGSGDWRLEFDTDLDIVPLAYVRTSDGFLTSMHEVAAAEGTAMRYHVPIFNPASNRNQRSRLRVVNLGDESTMVSIAGRDDRGSSVGRDVSFSLGPGKARVLTSMQLEQGGSGLSGRLGDGTGKWQLFASARAPLQVMSLLQSPTGNLTNLSGTARDSFPRGGSPPVAHDVPVSTDLSSPYIEVQLIGTDPDGDTLIYVLDGPGDGPGYKNAFVQSDSGRLLAELDPQDRDRVEIPYRVSDGIRFSEQASVIVTIDDVDTGALGSVPTGPRDYGALPRHYFPIPDEGLPPSVDLSGNFPPAGDQQFQSSCVGFATAWALKSYQERIEERWPFTNNTIFSPAWIYNQINGGVDRGSQIYDALQLIVDRGAATQASMPYSTYDYRTQPSSAVIREAARYKATDYARLGSIEQWKAALYHHNPVVIGIPTYGNDHFNTRSEVYLAPRGTPSVGHAVTVAGYDDARYGGAFKIINSWGRNAHDGSGYFWLPYSVIRNPAFSSSRVLQSYVLHDGPNDDSDRRPPPNPSPCGPSSRLPNLEPMSWRVEYDSQPGGEGVWQWRVQNTGQGTAPAGANVNLLLSADRRLDGSDRLVTYEDIQFSLEPGQSVYRDEGNALPFRLPETISPGTYYLVMWVDNRNDVRECNEDDNVLFGDDPIRFSFRLPDIGIEHWYAQWDGFGRGTLKYRVVNHGNAVVTNTAWDISLVLHTHPQPREGRFHYLFYEDATHVLDPGGSIYRDDTNPAYFDLRTVPSGLYYMSLWVDDLGEVRESNEWNNLSTGNGLVDTSYYAFGARTTHLNSGDPPSPGPMVPGAAFNGNVLPPQLTREVEIVVEEDGRRRVRILGEPGRHASLAPVPNGATAGEPSYQQAGPDTGEHFEKVAVSRDVLVFPTTNSIPMPE